MFKTLNKTASTLLALIVPFDRFTPLACGAGNKSSLADCSHYILHRFGHMHLRLAIREKGEEKKGREVDEAGDDKKGKK